MTQLCGHLNNIQDVIDNIYNYLRYNAITAQEFDSIGLTAKQFDDTNITAFDFDINSKSILLKYNDMFMFNPLNRKI